MYLYEQIDQARIYNQYKKVPPYVSDNLRKEFVLRPYQEEAFRNFITYFENDELRQKPTNVLFHMATGSGKTMIMAGLILYLYKQGYRNFLFFVNLTTILKKTMENFLNKASSKYLFSHAIHIDGDEVPIIEVQNFQNTDPTAINICFTTIQGLHMNLLYGKEGAMTYDDFDNQKIVLISDEAHHLNVLTKRNPKKTEAEMAVTWEQTVSRIVERNPNNILLEFTATCDLQNEYIKNAYERRIVYDYPLTKYYEDKYSKDIVVVRSETNLMNRVLQALVLSQYRLKLFQDWRLSIKPIVLFKADKIENNKKFFEGFSEFIKGLTENSLKNISLNAEGLLQRAFGYFKRKNISLTELAQELKEDFSKEHCLSVNDDKDAATQQILLNTLEDANNPYRAIFEVKKLDEGWDVLNLFDIVRLYETRQSSGKKVADATLSEAQLIGRGARYCPFALNEGQPLYKRKYDNDVDAELRICETLCYHCQYDHRYVNELKMALREIGIDLDKRIRRTYRLKDSFKDRELYKHGYIFINERKEKSFADVKQLPSIMHDSIYRYHVNTDKSQQTSIMVEEIHNKKVSEKTYRYTIREIANINYAFLHTALMKYPIYQFHTLQSYFPNIKSLREFITSTNYLGGVTIEIISPNERITSKEFTTAIDKAAQKIGEGISNIEKTYYGTANFMAKRIHEVFKDKTVLYTEVHDGGLGVSQNDSTVPEEYKIDLSSEDWFAYTDNFGTSEEKALVAFVYEHVQELREQYENVYLVRNEREFHLYSFDDGSRFEPDYVMFLQKKNVDGYEQIQLFIEPKGTHLLEKDEWKEKFLLSMKKKAIAVQFFKDSNSYKIWGLHFFNRDKRNKVFMEEFNELIHK